MIHKYILLSSAGLCAALLTPGLAAAQDTRSPSSEVEQVVVTARKSEEKLIDTPVTVTALTASRIEAQGLNDFKQISNFTPGVMITGATSSGGRAGAYIVFRGMTPSISANASVFIDGTPVAAGVVEAVADVERIELLKGPQTAYFGRSTFAGAINFVTKKPANVFQGKIDAIVGSDAFYEGRVTVEGPLIKDVLTARLSGRYFTKDGTYNNAAGGVLGDQETKSISLTVNFTPNSRFSAHAFGYLQKDEDGPQAVWKMSVPNYNCNAGAAPTNVFNYICGQLPTTGRIPLGQNLDITPAFKSIILGDSTGTVNPLFKDQFLDHIGYARKVAHGNLTLDYDFGNGFKLTHLSAVNFNRIISIFDNDWEDSRAFPGVGGANPNAPPFNNFAIRSEQYFDDWFEELRLSYNKGGRLRAVIGASYAHSATANLVSGIFNTGGASAFGLGAKTVAKTPAVFGNVSFDVLPQLTLNVEGRYQEDDIAASRRSKFLDTGLLIAAAKFKKFTPRVIVQWKPIQDTMIYASYAEGTNPGTFNTAQLAFSADLQARLTAATGVGLVVQPESIKNYELGVKSQFWDRKAQITAAIYYAKWTDQIVPQVYFDVATGNSIAVNTNIGLTELKGFEIEGELRPLRQLSINGLFAIADSNIKTYVCVACRAFAGPNVSVIGNELYRYSKYNAALAVEWRDDLNDRWQYFGRMDYVYKGPQYADETNIAKSAPQNTVALRAGIESDRIKLEGFVTNTFDDKGPLSLLRTNDGLRGGQVYFQQVPPERRRVGIRASYKFGGEEAPPPAPPPPPPPPPPAPPPPTPPARVAYEAREFVVYFPFDQYVLTPEAQQVISQAADYAKGGNATRVVVVGHADTSGSAAYNVKLSERRAKATADALVGSGLAQTALAVDWKGESQPAVATGDGVKEPLNRRATININF